MSVTGLKNEYPRRDGWGRWLAPGVRIATVALGLAVIGWSDVVAPVVWRQASMAPLGPKIVAGERFQPGVLEEYVERAKPDVLEGICQPITLRTLALARLRLAEEAIADGDGHLIDQTQSDGEAALRLSLSCTPTDPFLWFALFWLRNSREGLQDDNYRALRMSYRVGPNEGWLSLRRNRMVIALYPGLPDDLKQDASDEFVQLVRSDLITEAAGILAGPGRPLSTMLLARLKGVDQKKLRFLATLLAAKGLDDDIPGLETTSKHPWQH
jgi:hypothetical protein